MCGLRPSPLPSARRSSNETPPGTDPRPITCTSGRTSRSAGTTAAKLSSTTSAFTAASHRMNTCSGTARRQLSGTSMAPSRAQA